MFLVILFSFPCSFLCGALLSLSSPLPYLLGKEMEEGTPKGSSGGKRERKERRKGST